MLKFSKKIGAIILGLSMVLSPLQPITTNAAVSAISTETSYANTNNFVTVVNSNIPNFTAEQKTNTNAFENYSKLDKLGRCGVAFANICQQIMPTSERQDISKIHPSGWQSNMGWERCHLIGFQLAGENANKLNLITGTHQFNVKGMLPYENMVADYVKETNNHVLYRVKPKYTGNNLVADGVQIEAYSVEDQGEGICFNVYIKNIQDGCKINYATGNVITSKKSTQQVTGGKYGITYNYNTVKSASKYFYINAEAPGKITYSKKSGNGKISVASNGKVTIGKGLVPGTYKILVNMKLASTSKYNARDVKKYVTVKITKVTQKITGGTYTKTYKGLDAKNKTNTFYIKAKSSSKKLTYKKLSGSSNITVASNGKVTLKKGTKPGTYTVKVKLTAPATSIYNKKQITKTVKIVVKKIPTQQSNTQKVWITATGSKYHSVNNCGRTNPAKAQCVTLSEALSKGLTKCSICY